MKRKIITTVVCIILLIIFAVSAVNIIKICTDYNKANDIYDNLQESYVEIIAPSDQSEDAANEQEPDAVPINVDFDSLLKNNKDIVGWLYCPNTPINYPVVQGKDNSQYLYSDLDGKYLVSGTLFLDYRNGQIGEDSNHIIYGHNMKNGTMFAALNKYDKQFYYNEHPIFYYLTPNGNYKIELYAGLVVNQNALIYNPNPDKTEFTQFLENAKANSTFKSDVAIDENDTLITLSTCSSERSNARYILIGRLDKII